MDIKTNYTLKAKKKKRLYWVNSLLDGRGLKKLWLSWLVSSAWPTYPEYPIYHCSHVPHEDTAHVLLCSVLSLPWFVSLLDLLYNLWIIPITRWLPAPVPPHPQLMCSATPEESMPSSPDLPQYLGPYLALSMSSQILPEEVSCLGPEQAHLVARMPTPGW